jgi:hypothetical protein
VLVAALSGRPQSALARPECRTVVKQAAVVILYAVAGTLIYFTADRIAWSMIW